MIYTVGLKRIYEEYIDKDPVAAKDAGGSVWETYEDAKQYKRFGYDVYGVDANWDTETKVLERDDCDWRELARPARLIRL